MTTRGLNGKVTIVAGAAPGNIGGLTALRLADTIDVTLTGNLLGRTGAGEEQMA